MDQTRRQTLVTLAATLVVPLPAAATPEDVAASIEETFGPLPLAEGPITLELPPLSESGNSVPLTARVDSPMTADDRVLRLAVFAEGNPRPRTVEVVFGPAASEAVLTTHIRLASSQAVVGVAELSDGSLITTRTEVRVVVGACTTLPSRF